MRAFIKPAVLFALSCVISSSCISQRLNVDSIKNVIATTKVDTTRVLAIRKLASYYIVDERNDSLGLILLKQAELEAKKIRFELGICEVLLTQGNYHRVNSDWEHAISKYTELLEHADKLTDSAYQKKVKMMALNNLAGIYTMNGDYNKALEYYLKSRDFLESIRREANSLCLVYVNIASIYNALDQGKHAEEYLALCTPLLDSARPDLRYRYWLEKQTLADKKRDGKMVALAVDSLESSLKAASLSKMQAIAFTETLHQMKGKYLADYQKNYPAAIKEFETMLDLATQMEDQAEISSALFEIGNCYYLNGNLSQAIVTLENSHRIALTGNINEIVSKSSKMLSDIYGSMNNTVKAYDYLKVAYKLNDSLNTAKKLSQLNFLEAGYQTEKKEKEIALLQTANTERELTLVKRNRIIAITAVAVLALLLTSALLYRNGKQRQMIADKEKKLQERQIRYLEGQQQVISLQSMINGQETERVRIAKDLHDGLGGVFSTVKMHYSTLQHEVPEIKTNSLYRKTFDLIDNASEELRKVAHNMMPEVLMKVGLIEALRDLCNTISSGKNIQVSLQSYGMEKRLSTSTEIMLFRIIQELLNNIVKHAQASEAMIQFNRDGNRLSITIEDNGKGFDVRKSQEKQSMGMSTIRSRVDYLNGKLTIDSREGVGTSVMIDLVLNEN